MCFSAQASFTASAILALIGLIAVIKARHNLSLIPLATIPFIFAIQQLCEGIIWTSATHNPNGLTHITATYCYIFFAYFFWPIWIPFAMLVTESDGWRKAFCYSGLFAGLCFAIYRIIQISNYGVWSHIADCHIAYPTYDSDNKFMIPTLLYLYATAIPLLASRMRYTWLLSGAWAGSLLFTTFWYPAHIVSTWCFFAAIISILITLIVHTQMKNDSKR